MTNRLGKSMRILMSIALVVGSTVQTGFADRPASYDRSTDQHGFTTFMREGGWCWFQDPRAIAHDGKLYIGAIRGNGNGEAHVGVYDLDAKRTVGTAIMHEQFDRDDHNSPVFYPRTDGSVLAVYARHGKDLLHHSRISDPSRPLQWSNESTKRWQLGGSQDKVTYMNLFYLADEQLLYNFFRGIEYSPTFVTSYDEGITWSETAHLFQSEAEGRNRPYARYASNGKDTIYVSVTDGHPRNYGNSIYYFEFRDGNCYRADGTLIKNVATEGALRPSESDLVYRGSMTSKKPGGYESVPGAAWTSSIELDAAGMPHIAYSLYLNDNDHRYRLASWDGTKWVDRELAFAGTCLYPRESSYTGLITLDPSDPSQVFISTDVHPTTGDDTGGHHEIYRAKVGPEDDRTSIEWVPVTRQSPVPNIRPVVVRDGKRRIVLWNRGDFVTYKNYQLDTIGFMEDVTE